VASKDRPSWSNEDGYVMPAFLTGAIAHCEEQIEVQDKPDAVASLNASAVIAMCKEITHARWLKRKLFDKGINIKE